MAIRLIVVALDNGIEGDFSNPPIPTDQHKWIPGTILQVLPMSHLSKFRWGDCSKYLPLKASHAFDEEMLADISNRKKAIDITKILSAAEHQSHKDNATEVYKKFREDIPVLGYNAANAKWKKEFETSGHQPDLNSVRDLTAAGVLITTPTWQHAEVQ